MGPSRPLLLQTDGKSCLCLMRPRDDSEGERIIPYNYLEGVNTKEGEEFFRIIHFGKSRSNGIKLKKDIQFRL